MSTSTSPKSRGAQRHGTHGGGDDFHGGDEGGSGGGGGGNGGRLVKVAFVRNQIEGEMLQGLLAEEGIPSVLKRSRGFDNPDFLAGGPHDVWVNEGTAERAREVLAETMIEGEDQERVELEEQRRFARGETGVVSPARLAFWIAAILIGSFVLLWLLYQAT